MLGYTNIMSTEIEAQEREKIHEVLKTNFPFRGLSDDQIEVVIDHLGFLSLEQEDYIYQENEPGDVVCIVYSGRVRLTVWNPEDEREELVATLNTGNVFGLETMLGREFSTGAKSVRKAQVLILDQDHLQVLFEELGEIEEGLMLLAESFDLWQQKNFEWLNPGEPVYFVGRRHPLKMLLYLALPGLGLMLGVPIVVGLLSSAQNLLLAWILGLGSIAALLFWIFWIVIDYRNDYSIITSQRVLFQEKVVLLYDSRRESPIKAILAISTKTSQLGRIFGYGDVVVRTYAGLIVLPDLRYPDLVANVLEAEWSRFRAGPSKAERLSNLEGVVRQRVGLPEDQAAQAKAAGADEEEMQPALIQPSETQRFLANLFQLRFESGGAITYRKHWFILLQRIGRPSLALIALLAIFIARLSGAFSLFSVGGLIITLFALGLIAGGWWVYEYLDWRNDYFLLTDESVVDVEKKPLGKEERRAAPLKNIQSVSFERLGLIGLILNFGTVSIRVGETDLTFDKVFNPSQVQQEIFKRMAEQEYKKAQLDLQSESERFGDWIEVYDRLRANRAGQMGGEEQESR